MVSFLEGVLQTLFSFEDVDLSEGAVLGRCHGRVQERGTAVLKEEAWSGRVCISKRCETHTRAVGKERCAKGVTEEIKVEVRLHRGPA